MYNQITQLSPSRFTLSYLTDASVHFYCRPYFDLKMKYDSILEVFTVLFISLRTYFITLEYRIHDFQVNDGRHKYRASSTSYETRAPSPIVHVFCLALLARYLALAFTMLKNAQ